MKIGIAGPVSIKSLKQNLAGLSDEQLLLGMGGTAVNNLINALINQGYAVSVYTLDERVTQPIVMKGPRLTVFMGQYRPRGRSRMTDFFYHESSQIKQFILADKPDVVNAHWTYEFAIGTIRATDRHLLTFRDSSWEILKFHRDPYRFIRYLMDWWVRRNGKHFSVNSPYLQEILDLPNDKLPIVPNPVNETYLKTKGKTLPVGKNIKIVSLFNGWIDRKNPINAVKAFHQLIEQGHTQLEYHIYGRDCEPEQEPSKWVTANGMDTNVFFHGEIEHAALMKELPEYDILLHPALEESFGNTLVEAMGCGIPVVAGKDAGAVPWVLNYGKNGILVDVKSPEAIADGLLKLLKDKTIYEQLSNDGLIWVNEQFSPKTIAEQYVKLYKSIIDTTPVSALLL
jgi:L-malate glycosyltransferase